MFATYFYLALSMDQHKPSLFGGGRSGGRKLRVSIVRGQREVKNEGCGDWQMRCKEGRCERCGSVPPDNC